MDLALALRFISSYFYGPPQAIINELAQSGIEVLSVSDATKVSAFPVSEGVAP